MRREHLARGVDDADALIHRALAQRRVCIMLGQVAAIHQQPFRAIDQLAVGQFALDIGETAAQLRVVREAHERYLEDRCEALGRQSFDEIGADARADRRADQRLVGIVAEHQYRARRGRVHHRELFERVARGRIGIDDHDVGALRLDRGGQPGGCRHVVQHFVAEMGKRLAQVADRLVGIGDEQHAQLGGRGGRTHDANGGNEAAACAHVHATPRRAVRRVPERPGRLSAGRWACRPASCARPPFSL